MAVAFFLGGLAFAAAAAVRIYLAERLIPNVTVEDLRHAVRIAPKNSNAWARLGTLLERQGDSAGAVEAFERAVALNRFNGGAWIDLALHWEFDGDAKRSEQCLLEANRVDGSLDSRWALANFYLRQGGGELFWEAMRRVVSHSGVDLTAAFELCWRASEDPAEILDKAVPDEPEINRSYFRFLFGNKPLSAWAGPWKRLENRLEERDADMALRYADALLSERQVEKALHVWNRLAESGVAGFQSLDPAGGRLVTNGNFAIAPTGLGFDWRPVTVEGIAVDSSSEGGESRLSLRFSGAHPESTELLSQWAPVETNRTYRLSFRYITEDLPADTGLYWVVRDDSAPLASGSPLPSAREWRNSTLTFQSGHKTRLARVLFLYSRSAGTTRAQGSASITNVNITPVQRSARNLP